MGGGTGPRKTDDKVTVLAHADDVAVFAASKDQAAKMMKDMSKALQGLNLQLPPEKRSALWSQKPEGSDTEKKELGEARVPIEASLVILGQEVTFRTDSAHCFQHRLRQALKAAHANTTLHRSTSTSHGQRIKLLQSLVKPCLLCEAETWKLTPGFWPT